MMEKGRCGVCVCVWECESKNFARLPLWARKNVFIRYMIWKKIKSYIKICDALRKTLSCVRIHTHLRLRQKEVKLFCADMYVFTHMYYVHSINHVTTLFSCSAILCGFHVSVDFVIDFNQAQQQQSFFFN